MKLSFINDIASDPDDQEIIRTIISMGHSLRRKVVAEGVETEEQRILLRKLRCDEMQGYLFARPASREALDRLLAEDPTLVQDLANELANILAGNMSFVGPRPLLDCDQLDAFRDRLWVRPGLTGWAQVNFPYGASVEDTREKLRYDLFYIRNHSFLLDFQIVLKTIYVVLAKAGGK